MAKLNIWLESIGLGRYGPTFEAAEVDLETLRHLTEDDLREMGLPVGPRRKILAAREVPKDISDGPDGVTAASPERRQLTVMFVDLVGSTNMSVRVDPEVLSKLLTSYKTIVSDEISRGGGTVGQYLGDGVLAYFGWPHAGENAAEFAIRCAFQVIARIKQLCAPDGEPLRCRVGIATGLAVVGRETGPENARENFAAGEALNLAARLQSLAQPDEVIIAETTHRLVGKLFVFEDRGEQSLKGFDAAVRVWCAVRPAFTASRFAAVRALRAPLVGRADELALLVGRWGKARAGEGRAILISGEAGIGKSRLVDELRNQISDSSHSFIVWQCSAFHQTQALYPVIDFLNYAAGITDFDLPAMRLEKLARLLADAGMLAGEGLALFAEILSIDPEAGYVRSDMLPTQKRMATIAAIAQWIQVMAEQRPLLLLLEDGHWIDATTLELMSSLIAKLPSQAVLAIVTSRPGFQPPWLGRPQVSTIGLDRLSKPECEALVRELASDLTRQDKTISQIVSKGDGNPLFLEELSLAVFDPKSALSAAVPDSLQSSLMSRLDALGAAKEMAQICSTLGRRFARPLLAKIADFPDHVLDDNLAALVSHDIIYPLGNANDARYEFKHALVRDAAYDSLLLSTRRRLHESCARHLEQSFTEVVRTEPELLAHHFSEAGQPRDASRYAALAGDRAANSSSFVEAISNYRIALDQLELLPANSERVRTEIALLLKLGPALSVIDGVQAPSVGKAYLRAQEIARELGDEDNLFKAGWGLWYHANIGRQFDEAGRHVRNLTELGERSGNGSYRLEALHCSWSSAMFRGDYQAAIEDTRRGIAMYDRDLHHTLCTTFGGHDPGVCAYGAQSNSLSLLGRFDQSVTNVDRAIKLAEQLDHAHTFAHALMVGTTAAVIARDLEATTRHGERLLELSAKYHFPPPYLTAEFFLGWASAEAGQKQAGIQRMEAVFPRVLKLGPMTYLYAGVLADQLLRDERPAEAIQVVDQAIRDTRWAEKGMFVSEIYRVRGEALWRLQREPEAAAELRHSYEVAQRQGSALFQIRTIVGQLRAGATGEVRHELERQLRALLALQESVNRWPDFLEATALC